jgi:hypothetical protein
MRRGRVFNGMIGETAIPDQRLPRNEIYELAQTKPD